ncbi:MAG: glycosyltransferase family 2 protein [Thermoguttaceae bacterium]
MNGITPGHSPQVDSQTPSLSIVLSFANEEAVLPEAIHRLRAVLGAECDRGTISRYELVFVNDASTDRSLAILQDAARGHDDIRVLNMSRNFGVTPCVLAGMDYASGDLVVYMDVDLQDPPETIPEMLHAWRAADGADVVHTVRRSRSGESWIKLAVTRLGYRILKCVSSVPVRVEAGDFKLLSRRAVDELRRLREKRPFMRGLVAWIGLKQTEIHYDRQARAAGDTKFPVFGAKVIRNFLDSALISFSDIPLQLATLMGLLISLASFVFLIDVVVEKILGRNIPGWTAIMATMLFVGGAQMLFLGIQGRYIAAIFLETKGRPNYIVESTLGFPGPQDRPPPELKP